MLIRSVVESVLDVETSDVVVSSSAGPGLSVVAGVSPFVDVDALGAEVDWLSVASSSPEPVDVCVGTTVAVVEDDVAAAVSRLDAAVQAERGLCFLIELMDHVKDYVLVSASGDYF